MALRTVSSKTGTTSPVNALVQQYVHRRAASQVLLTDWQPEAAGGFLVNAEWPGEHELYAPLGGRWHDPLLMVETARQAGLAIGHSALDVPVGDQFILRTLVLRQPRPAPAGAGRPARVEVGVQCREPAARSRSSRRLDYRFTLGQDGVPIASAEMTANVLPMATYTRLRKGRGPGEACPGLSPRPESALVTNRRRPCDVVIGPATTDHAADHTADHAADPAARTHPLHVDTTHRFYFDHPLDHIPGMLLLDAARQAVQARMHPRPVVPLELEAEFLRYAELDHPCQIRLEQTGRDSEGRLTAGVTAVQNEVPVFRCRLVLAELAELDG